MQDLQFSLKLLIFMSVPMKADSDTHIAEHKSVLSLLIFYLRSGQYADTNKHSGISLEAV